MKDLQIRLVRLLAMGLFLTAASSARAQDLEPRAYAPAPMNANFVITNYSYQSGEVLFDPSLPFSDVRAFINGVVGGYGHVQPLRADLVRRRRGPVRLGVGGRQRGRDVPVHHPLGPRGPAPALRREPPRRAGALDEGVHGPQARADALGFSVIVVAPTGQYSNEKLINIGTNRWAFRPEFGLSYPAGHWTLEASAGVWLFLDNTQTYPGENVRLQDPLYTLQAHVGYTVRPGLWIAADATYYAGGKTYTNDIPGDTRQANSRAGLTASVPVARGHFDQGVRLNGRGRPGRIPFRLYGIAYQYLWLSRPGK